MKKRILSVVCALTLAFGSAAALPLGHFEQTVLTAAAQELDLSEEAVYKAMIAFMDEYPEGTPWTNENYYAWKGGTYSGGYGCAGFAFMLSDAAFGDLKARPFYDVDEIRVGDILRINNNTHSVIVLDISDGIVTVAEGNYNKSVHWGRSFLLVNLKNIMDFGLTRYPDGSQTPDPDPDPQPSQYFYFTELDDGTMEVYAYTGDEAEVRIPDTVNGKKVTSIDDLAFCDCENLVNVTLPESLTKIGERAFYYCTSLKSITIPKSVNKIGANALGYYVDAESGDTKFIKVSGFVIKGYKNSAAETYAKENGFTFIALDGDTRKKGDLNNNGKIDASDLLQVKSHIKKVQLLEGDDFKAADVDGNGTINASDLLKMKAHMKGVTPIWE